MILMLGIQVTALKKIIAIIMTIPLTSEIVQLFT